MDLDELCAEMHPLSDLGLHQLQHPIVKHLYAPALTMRVAGWFVAAFNESCGSVSAERLWAYFQSRPLDKLAGESAYGDVFKMLAEDGQVRTTLTEDGLFIVVGNYAKRD